MYVDDVVGVLDTVFESRCEIVVALVLVPVLPGVGSGDVDHVCDGRWKVTGFGVHRFRHSER